MQKIIELYNEVFNSDGTVKNCGKDKCTELIIAMKGKYKGKNFGDVRSGMMNVKEIQEVYKGIMSSEE